MKLIGILILIAALLFPQSSYTQRRSRTSGRTNSQANVAAEKSWPSFFTAFRAAVKKRSRAALRKMLAPDLLYSLGHHRSDHLDEAFRFWDTNNGRGWKAFNRIWLKGLCRKLVGGMMAKTQKGQVVWIRQRQICESTLTGGVSLGMQSLSIGNMVAGIAPYFRNVVIEPTAQSNNSFNRSGISLPFIR